MAKLSPARQRMLVRLSEVDDDKVFMCSGHQSTACAGLAALGLAEHLGHHKLGIYSFYRITEAGRRALNGDTNEG